MKEGMKNRESSLFKLLSSNTNEWVVTIDLSLNIATVNTTCADELHMKVESLIGKKFSEIAHTLYLPPLFLKNFSDQETLKIVKIEINQQEFSWVVHKVSASDTSYLLIGKFSSYRKILNKYLSLEVMLEHMPCNVYWMDKELTHLGCNQNVLDMCGISREQYNGSTYEEISEWANWPDGLASSFKSDDIQVLTTGQPKLNVQEPAFKASDGSDLYLLTSRVPLRDSSGDIVGVGGISTDITEFVLTRKKMEASIKALNTANKAKSEFMRNMGHDIRTPITGMIALIQHLYTSAPTQYIKKNAKELMDTTAELLHLLNEILEVTKLESGQYESLNEIFNLRSLVQSNERLIKPMLKTKNLNFKLLIDKNLPHCFFGQKNFINRILLNTLGNAIKFTKKGTVTLELKLLKEEDNNASICISISDTGIGIPKNKIDIIFNNFSRLTPSYENEFDGHGLGLYIVKKYVDQMGGTVTVDSQEGKGTTINIMLSLAISSDKQALENPTEFLTDYVSEETTVPDSLEGSADVSSIINVLVVEDSPLAGMMVVNLLESLGCKCSIVESGTDALRSVRKFKYDLIVLDIGLPDMEGTLVAQKLREMKIASPIIGLSGHAEKEYKVKCIDSGMNNMYTKPLSPLKGEEIISFYFPEKTNIRLPKNNEKIIDLDLGASLANGDHKKAQEFLFSLITLLPDETNKIKKAFDDDTKEELYVLVHRLMGSVCYCGVPKLQKSINRCHKLLATQGADFNKLNIAINDLIMCAEEVVSHK